MTFIYFSREKLFLPGRNIFYPMTKMCDFICKNWCFRTWLRAARAPRRESAVFNGGSKYFSPGEMFLHREKCARNPGDLMTNELEKFSSLRRPREKWFLPGRNHFPGEWRSTATSFGSGQRLIELGPAGWEATGWEATGLQPPNLDLNNHPLSWSLQAGTIRSV